MRTEVLLLLLLLLLLLFVTAKFLVDLTLRKLCDQLWKPHFMQSFCVVICDVTWVCFISKNLPVLQEDTYCCSIICFFVHQSSWRLHLMYQVDLSCGIFDSFRHCARLWLTAVLIRTTFCCSDITAETHSPKQTIMSPSKLFRHSTALPVN